MIRARGAAFAELDAFVEPLRRGHGALGGEADALVGRLLERGRGEGRQRIARALLFLHLRHHEGLTGHGLFEGVGRGLAGDENFARAFFLAFVGAGKFLQLFGEVRFNLGKLRLERRGRGSGKQRAEGPEFFGHEGEPFLFAFHDEAQRHRLHSSGGNAALHGFPQQRRNLVAHETVEHAAGLLGVEEIGIDVVRMFQGVLHGAGRDFVELNALDVLRLVLDDLGDVPGNGFPFAVRVGSKVHGVGLGGRFLQIAHHLFLALDDFVVRGKVVGFIHADFSGGQIAYMTYAGLHHVFVSQKFLDGLHLGR